MQMRAQPYDSGWKLNTTESITHSSCSARWMALATRLVKDLCGAHTIALRHTSHKQKPQSTALLVLLQASSPLVMHQHHSTSTQASPNSSTPFKENKKTVLKLRPYTTYNAINLANVYYYNAYYLA